MYTYLISVNENNIKLICLRYSVLTVWLNPNVDFQQIYEHLICLKLKKNNYTILLICNIIDLTKKMKRLEF